MILGRSSGIPFKEGLYVVWYEFGGMSRMRLTNRKKDNLMIYKDLEDGSCEDRNFIQYFVGPIEENEK